MKTFLSIIFFYFISVVSQAQAINNLKEFFGENEFTIIGNQLTIHLDSLNYPLSSKQYILFYFEYQEIKAAKKLAFEAQNISIIKSDFEKYKSKIIDLNNISPVKIYYRNENTGNTDLICTIKLHFIDRQTLENDFKIINRIYSKKNLNSEAISQYMLDYFVDNYGNTDKSILMQLISDAQNKKLQK